MVVEVKNRQGFGSSAITWTGNVVHPGQTEVVLVTYSAPPGTRREATRAELRRALRPIGTVVHSSIPSLTAEAIRKAIVESDVELDTLADLLDSM